MNTEFEIVKTMRKHKGKWIYFIHDKKRKFGNTCFEMIVGRIIWDGEKFRVDNK